MHALKDPMKINISFCIENYCFLDCLLWSLILCISYRYVAIRLFALKFDNTLYIPCLWQSNLNKLSITFNAKLCLCEYFSFPQILEGVRDSKKRRKKKTNSDLDSIFRRSGCIIVLLDITAIAYKTSFWQNLNETTKQTAWLTSPFIFVASPKTQNTLIVWYIYKHFLSFTRMWHVNSMIHKGVQGSNRAKQDFFFISFFPLFDKVHSRRSL